jgi:hypothetical protein
MNSWQRFAIVVVALIAFASASSQLHAALNPGILDPGQTFRGLTYGQWSARWWQWAFSIPVDRHPLYDTADCSAGQSGHVWFLGASFTASEPSPGQFLAFATRKCTVPAGIALFFPILNSEASTAEGNGTTERVLRSAAKSFQDFAANLAADVDGVPIQSLDNYRVQSPLFTWGLLPENNVLQATGFKDLVAGTQSPAVGDGVYLMVEPLRPGRHTIHFKEKRRRSTSRSILLTGSVLLRANERSTGGQSTSMDANQEGLE